jgi:NADP-dependent 3-hydroxy acid dehydrogenase YdfG
MSDYLGLDGCRALVTGGTKGIGAAVAGRLREAGAKVLVTARSRPDVLGPDDLFVPADITSAEGCATVADAVSDRLGGIDIVVHVVGGSSAPSGGFVVLDDDEWHGRSTCSVPGGPVGPRAIAQMPTRATGLSTSGRSSDAVARSDHACSGEGAPRHYSKVSKEVSPKGVRVIRVAGWVETEPLSSGGTVGRDDRGTMRQRGRA